MEAFKGALGLTYHLRVSINTKPLSCEIISVELSIAEDDEFSRKS